MPRHLPYSLKPELVRGCTMRCVFCALKHQSWAEQDYQYISMDLWDKYVEAVAAWRPKVRVEIANRGEPTVHPKFLEIIKRGREALPQAQFLCSTNGDLSDRIGLPAFKEFVEEAQANGINCFLLDCYTPKRLRDFQELFKGNVGAFFDDSVRGGAGLNPYPYRGPEWKALVIKDAVPQRQTKAKNDGLLPADKTRKPKENVLLKYHNQGGNAVVTGAAAEIYDIPVLDEPLQRMCVRPFREMPMWFDGSIPICCDDWADANIIGKFPTQSLPDLWDAFDEFRQNLINRDRGAQKPCNKCSEGAGKRFGLELDWFGK